jgi:hypothetical protein
MNVPEVVRVITMDLAPRPPATKSTRIILVTGDRLNRILHLLEDDDIEVAPVASCQSSGEVSVP